MNSEMKGDTGRGLGGTRGQQQLERATALRHTPVSPKPSAPCASRVFMEAASLGMRIH